MPQPLSDNQRKLIHDLALTARDLLMREARELLEGVYGVYASGKVEPADRLPQVRSDVETAATHASLVRFLDDEVAAGLKRPDAVEKLAKEVAFTHLNRLVAFKMMEARKLIRGTVDKGVKSNAFLFYLADPEHAADYARHQQGDSDTAYRHFLLWQAGQVAQELRVLFDPDTLPSRLFPRPRALNALIDLLNAPELAPVWQVEETIGWLYQFFNEQEKADVFDRLYGQKQKIRRQDIPAATQLFTPYWIVRYLVQNTLGRLWVQMHPDTALLGSELLDYLVPLQGETPAEPLRPLRDITLLDPACGTMHFGLVAFDLLAAMYREELARAGEPGWPAEPSAASENEIAAAIIEHNLYGIDIDLRAVQLSALALYLKAKGLNPQARITDSNLACADVLPLNGKRLGTFLREAGFSRPVYERLIRALWARLKEAADVGSLLRLERDIRELIEEERRKVAQAPLFAGLPGEFEREALQEDFWEYLDAQIVQGLDEFARQQAAAGVDQRFFTGEAVKGLRLLNVMLDEYDVVVTNPPYSGKSNLNDTLAAFLDSQYKDEKGDLYAAFIRRCSEFVGAHGRLGMITQQSFMFISSYETLRENLRARFAIETMAHTGPRAFAEISGEKVNTTAFTLRVEANTTHREGNVGSYVRLVNAAEGDGKRQAFEQALQDGSNTYHVSQSAFSLIPGCPWAYWVPRSIRESFHSMQPLDETAKPRQGLATAQNERFLRYWWEIGPASIDVGANSIKQSVSRGKRWFPYMKGGSYLKWYGNQEHVVNWYFDGKEIRNFYKGGSRLASRPQNTKYYFKEGLTWGDLNPAGFSVRYSPGGFVFDVKGSSGFPELNQRLTVLGIMNSVWMQYALDILNPTASFQVGDIKRVPVAVPTSHQRILLEQKVRLCTAVQVLHSRFNEATFDYVSPPKPENGLAKLASLKSWLTSLEAAANDTVLEIYGFDQQERKEIEDAYGQTTAVALEDDAELLAVRWLSYALGIILGRFQPGTPNALGSAIYHPSQFAIGSLPEPSLAEFDELVGPPEQFAYLDADGGRHVFSRAVEQALRDLALPDGIAVLDAGHPRDLPTLVERALELMLGAEQAQEVIATATNGNPSGDLRASLRQFLERDYFVNYHVKQDWYRKRPVYWWLQSAKRSYGFVLFHEKIDANTLYVLQRDYLDAKRNGLRLAIDDLKARLLSQAGRDAKQTQRQIDQAGKLLEEIDDFAKTMARIVQEGYEPQPNWIDDGVILRMAPLWELIPIWKAEPQKYWEQLQAGDYDWSHIAMHYWPERVREACRTNKSFAIAHGHEEWYEGG